MSEPIYFNSPDIEDETLEEFIINLYESLEVIEHDLVVLERDPTNANTIASLFRQVLTIKTNCRLAFVEPLFRYMHNMEEVVAGMQTGRIPFSTYLKESILIALDYLRNCAETLAQVGKLEITLVQAVEQEFAQMASAEPQRVQLQAERIIEMLTGMEVDVAASTDTSEEMMAEEEEEESETLVDADLVFFHEVSERVDAHSPFWPGRTRRLYGMAMALNRELDDAVDDRALMAAVYLHDFGMLFIPEALLAKTGKLEPDEKALIQKHVDFGWEWLRRMPDWYETALMVYHHHERVDGSGYPNGLMGDEIHIGGKILAVADTFYSITTERADRNYKRSIIRAITEINNCVNKQFDEDVVAAFNRVIKRLHSK